MEARTCMQLLKKKKTYVNDVIPVDRNDDYFQPGGHTDNVSYKIIYFFRK